MCSESEYLVSFYKSSDLWIETKFCLSSLLCYFFRKSVTRQTCHLSSSGWRDDKNKITSEENCRNKNAFIILCKFSFLPLLDPGDVTFYFAKVRLEYFQTRGLHRLCKLQKGLGRTYGNILETRKTEIFRKKSTNKLEATKLGNYFSLFFFLYLWVNFLIPLVCC